MLRSSRRWWIGGIIVIFIIGFITWQGVREEALPTTASFGTAVVVKDPPVQVRTGVPVQFAWEVRAPIGSIAISTAIHWGPTSIATVNDQTTPDELTFAGQIIDYAVGRFALPRTFTGAVVFASPGTYYYRAHALIDEKNIWSPEYEVVVE
ncbi:MAG: hypothetical protein ABIG71_00720 [Candidatus Uhrbacteria bacterium]